MPPRGGFALAILFGVFAAVVSYAQDPKVPEYPCWAIGKISAKQPIVLHTKRDLDAVDELIQFETRYNLPQYRKSTVPLQIPFTTVSRKEAWVDKTSDVARSLLDFFFSKGSIRWPLHPWNQDEKVPFTKRAPTGAMTVQLTASRSLVFRIGKKVYSFKTGTDYPHTTEKQPGKAEMSEDTSYSVETTRLIDELDAKLKPDNDLLILRDVLAAGDNKKDSGWVVRDLTPLVESGNRYLPALSLPYVGARFTQGQPFETYWRKNYAEAVGRAKAKLFLRYGIVMKTPNPQNILVELNPDGVPTGRIVFRDVVDSRYVTNVSDVIVGKDRVEAALPIAYFKSKGEKYAWDTSLWRLEVDGPNKLSNDEMTRWDQAHDRAFIQTLEQALGKKLAVGEWAWVNYQNQWLFNGAKSYQAAYEFLSSEAGRAALAKYHQDNKKEAAPPPASAPVENSPSLITGTPQ